jgi:thioester reductase-like protein
MTVLLTGFPGFLGSALLPRLLAAGDESAVCVVQPRFAETAARRLQDLLCDDPSLEGRVRLVVGDVTQPGLGIADAAQVLSHVADVWHLAAVYDMSVPRDLAMLVNVRGTEHVLDLAARAPRLRRVHYFSTCYVSGRYAGPFGEDDLDVGAPFNNYYEETKHLAEVDVRRRMAEGLPATIYRPSVVVGDSTSGATQKYDGVYFAIQWLLRQPKVAVLPTVGDLSMTRPNIVPRDFVLDAAAYLAALPQSLGRCYQLADPQPLTADELVDVLAAATGHRVVRMPLPRRAAKGALAHVPGVHALLRIPPGFVDHYVHPTHYLTDHARADLEGSGITCPAFPAYADTLVRFMREHRDVTAAAMV